MDMSPVHQIWPEPSCKAQWKGEEDKADRKRCEKTTLRNGQAWSSPSPRGQWRAGKNEGNRLWSHLWCPNNPCGWGISEVKEDLLHLLRQEPPMAFKKKKKLGDCVFPSLSLSAHQLLCLCILTHLCSCVSVSWWHVPLCLCIYMTLCCFIWNE